LIKGVIFGVGGKIEEPLPHNVPLRVDLGFEVLEVNDKSKALWDRLISKGYGIRYASFEAKGHAQTLLKKLGVEMNVKALEEYGPYKFGDAAVYISRVDGSADSEVKQVVVKFRPAESYAVLSQGLRADGFEMKEDGSLECKDVKMGDLIRKLGHAFFIKNYWQSRETDGKRYFVYNDSEYSAVVSPLDNPGVLPELSQRVAVRVFQFFPSGQDGLSKAVK
jgi:hypothetical protein